MNATKRKFNALMSGIGSKPNTSVPTTPKDTPSTPKDSTTPPTADADAQAKKRRTDMPYSTTQVPTFSDFRKLQSIKHKKSASVAVAPAADDTPRYAPWDRGEFLKRLKSFSNLTDWTPKPARVNEVEWAKRGWICQKNERVRCSLCHTEILVKLNKKDVDGKEVPVYVPNNIEEALVERYEEMIVTSHEENCLWRKRGCDDSIFKLPLTNTANTMQSLKERYQDLIARKDNLPYTFNMRTPEGFDIDTVIGCLLSDFLQTPSDVDRVAIMMAMFGWEGHSHPRMGPQLGSLSCQACFRVLGLWLFKSKSVNEAGEELVGPVVNGLDVALEHREYCPWRNSASQNGRNPAIKSNTNHMAGWEILVRLLKSEHQLKTNKESPKSSNRRPMVDENGHAAEDMDDSDAMSIRDEKDKERWTRLRRVKSLFEPKGGKKVQRGEVTKSSS